MLLLKADLTYFHTVLYYFHTHLTPLLLLDSPSHLSDPLWLLVNADVVDVRGKIYGWHGALLYSSTQDF